MEEAVSFTNRRGRKLFGVVHLPEGGVARGAGVAVNLLNPGIKYRVAPNRLNVKLARELCARGYPVLRLDPEGVGDSEGELPAGEGVAGVWAAIQGGLFVEDVLAANSWLERHQGASRLALVGNCGGAITALLAGARDRRVRALGLVDVPVYLGGAQFSFADTAVAGGRKADWLFSEYVRRIFRPAAWRRFLTNQTDYRALWRVVALKARSAGLRSRREADLDRLCRENKLNRGFFEAFERCVEEGKRLLFVLAENDHGTEIFRTHFEGAYLGSRRGRAPLAGLVETRQVDGANHVFTLAEWQEALFAHVGSWVETALA